MTPPPPFDEVLDILPIGIAIIDAQQKIVLMNPAFHQSIGLPSDGLPPGTRVEDAVRACAYRGIYGPGDPEAQVKAIMAADRTKPGRLRRRTFGGRNFDLFNTPLGDGGYVVSAVETTALVNARADTERALAQVTTAVATLRIGVGAFGRGGRLLFANPRFAELLALSPDHMAAGTTFGALLDMMETRDEFGGADGLAFVAAQRAVNRSEPSSMRHLRSSSQLIDLASAPLPDGGWTITITDISPLARAEDEASRRARLLDSILEAVPHGICVYNAGRRVTLFNRAYTDVMTGAPLAVGDHITDVIRRRAESGEFGQGRAQDIFAQQMAFDITRTQMRRRRRPDGTAIDVRTAPLPDGGHISVVTDITPLVQAEEEIGRRAADMTVMLANIQHGIVFWGADGRLVANNAIAGDLLGHPPGLLTPGRTEDEVLDNMAQRGEWGGGENAERTARLLRERDRGKPFAQEMVTRSGRVVHLRSDPAPGGGWVSTYTDVTEARRTEQELRRAKEAAEAANQAKSHFLATMSHELRTPLNLIIGFSDALMRDASSGAEQTREFGQQINDAGRQLLSLINIILDVARIEAGRMNLGADQVNLGRLVRSVMRQADAAAQVNEVTLTVDLPADLPDLNADERRLHQALAQVVSNAVKFTNPGGTVTVGARMETDGDLLLYVEDTGIGIAPESLDRVFEPFIQLDDALSRRYQGAGLGLYVARAMVMGHGGRLTLRSTPGIGTVAEIRLPAGLLLH
jgi:signal transduction histidine kinase